MKTHLRLSVSGRLFAGFGLMSALLLAVCGVGLYNAHVSQTLVQGTAQDAQARMKLATEMRNSIQEQDIRLRQIGLLTDVPQMQQQADLAKSAELKLRKALDELQGMTLSPAEKKVLESLKKVNADGKVVADQALALAVGMMNEEAAKVISGPLETSSAKRRELAQRFADIQAVSVEGAYARIVSEGEHAKTLLVIVAVLGLSGAVLCSALVYRSIATPLREAVHLAERVANGDLSVRLSPASDDELGRLTGSLDAMASRLRLMIGAVRQTSESIMVASSEISSGNQDLSVRTERQASSLQETASTVEEMTQSVGRSAGAAKEAASLAEAASNIALQGGENVEQVVKTIEQIVASSRRIGDIVAVIDGIAFQTNILALNAAVEAARAGEQGRGFAVVASEVRTLAQRSAGAAREIRGLIAQNMTTVEGSTELVGKAGLTMSKVVAASRQVSTIIGEISQAAQEQSKGLATVNVAVSAIDQATQQNAALVEQAAAAAASLNEQTRSLNESMAEFRLQ